MYKTKKDVLTLIIMNRDSNTSMSLMTYTIKDRIKDSAFYTNYWQKMEGKREEIHINTLRWYKIHDEIYDTYFFNLNRTKTGTSGVLRK